MKESLTKKEKIKGKIALKQFFLQSFFQVKCKGANLRYKSNDLSYNRVTFCLVRSFSNSVCRNRAKRVFREIYRKNKARIKQGYDLAFILFPGENETEKRKEQFEQLLSKAQLFVESK